MLKLTEDRFERNPGWAWANIGRDVSEDVRRIQEACDGEFIRVDGPDLSLLLLLAEIAGRESSHV